VSLTGDGMGVRGQFDGRAPRLLGDNMGHSWHAINDQIVPAIGDMRCALVHPAQFAGRKGTPDRVIVAASAGSASYP
jgi:hypothetical protein